MPAACPQCGDTGACNGGPCPMVPPECTASRTGYCLREAESETACDTETGECVHGGRTHRCPCCGEDLTDYGEDDFVYLVGDERPYCSHECVVRTYREKLRREEKEA